MSAGQVLLEYEDGTDLSENDEASPPIAVLTLDREGRRNAMDQAMWDDLRANLERAAERPPRVLLITGAGGHFSAGADLQPDNPMFQRLLPAISRRDATEARAIIQELKAIADLLAAFPAPTIAAIEGNCVGGGLELALACDLRVVARDARLGLPEVRLGFIPDIGGTARLTKLLGPARAAELILTSRLVDGVEAQAIGLCQRLCPTGEALRAALELAHGIMGGGPLAVMLALQVIRQTPDLDLADAMAVETEAAVGAMVSGEVLEGGMAFLQKRQPRWARR